VAVAAVITGGVMIFWPTSHPVLPAPIWTDHPSAGHDSPVRSASSNTAATWPVASQVADLSEPLPGMPPVPDPANIYADAGATMFSSAVRGVPYRIYVPNSGCSTVTVINPATYKVIGTYQAGLNPQHVVPAYDMRTLYATNDLGNSLTPVNPMTGRPAGPNIAVDDPHNMYFTPDGRYAIVVAETLVERNCHPPRDVQGWRKGGLLWALGESWA
jgi:YVTN family beta-propeller protein